MDSQDFYMHTNLQMLCPNQAPGTELAPNLADQSWVCKGLLYLGTPGIWGWMIVYWGLSCAL
jgi:hypothetical protein